MSKKHSDWRLPTIEELLTLVNYEKRRPACDLEDTISSSRYWSSITYVDNTDYAWDVYFYYGSSSYYNKTNNYYVRCVRNSKKGLQWSKSSDIAMNWDEAFEYAEGLVDTTYYKAKEKKISKNIKVGSKVKVLQVGKQTMIDNGITEDTVLTVERLNDDVFYCSLPSGTYVIKEGTSMYPFTKKEVEVL